jgi:hypothetical protein
MVICGCNHQVDIPGSVNQDSLNCLLSKDGILQVEGPVITPTLMHRETFLPVKNAALNSQPVRHLGMGTPVKNPIGKGTALETVLMCSKSFQSLRLKSTLNYIGKGVTGFGTMYCKL